MAKSLKNSSRNFEHLTSQTCDYSTNLKSSSTIVYTLLAAILGTWKNDPWSKRPSEVAFVGSHHFGPNQASRHKWRSKYLITKRYIIDLSSKIVHGVKTSIHTLLISLDGSVSKTCR